MEGKYQIKIKTQPLFFTTVHQIDKRAVDLGLFSCKLHKSKFQTSLKGKKLLIFEVTIQPCSNAFNTLLTSILFTLIGHQFLQITKTSKNPDNNWLKSGVKKIHKLSLQTAFQS